MNLRLHRASLAGLAVALIAPGAALGSTLHPKLIAKAGYGSEPVGFARTADGTLHVAVETNIDWGDSANGIAASAISPSGHLGPQIQALSWGVPGGSPNGIPGLAVLPGGTLEAVFGGSPNGDDGPWGISSTDGGSSWSAPTDIGSGAMEFGDSDLTLQTSNGAPVFTAGCCGGIVVQNGFGTGSATYQLTNSADNAALNTDSAVEPGTGAVVAGWDSVAGSGGHWLQEVAPATGPAEKVPVPPQYGTGEPVIVAGRSSGLRIFTAYPSNYGNTTHMRLMAYGHGPVGPVESVKGLHADAWGVGTSSDGRIWLMWYGQINGKGVIAVTRSNPTETVFEPIQLYHFNWLFLSVLEGDGRLGPLDMLINGTPSAPLGQPLAGGIYWARVLAELSPSVSVTKLSDHKFRVTVEVRDAGDAVKGVMASALGQSKTTNGAGRATLTVTGSSGEEATVTIGKPGYNTLSEGVTLR